LKAVNIFRKHALVGELITILKKNDHQLTHLKGLVGSASTLLIANAYEQMNKPFICLLPDRESAAYFYTDLTNFLGDEQVIFFPSSYKHIVLSDSVDSAGVIVRTETLNRLNKIDQPLLIVTYPDAVIEKVITKNVLQSNTFKLAVDEKFSIPFITELLQEYEFQRVDFVYEPGQYSVRGSIIDIFSFSNDLPYRIDFFGDEIETIRTFDITTQLSIAKLHEIAIIPDIQHKLTEESQESFFNFIPESAIIITNDYIYFNDCIESLTKEILKKNPYIEDEKTGNYLPATNFLIAGDEITSKLKSFDWIELSNRCIKTPQNILHFNTNLQPDFNKNFHLLGENLLIKTNDSFEIYILSDNQKQIERLQAIFEAEKELKSITFTPIYVTIHAGFVDNDLKVCLYTDHQIFQRYHRFRTHKSEENLTDGKLALTLKELSGLQPGDFVVHVDHGIGKFGGLERVEINGKMQEVIRLVFDGNDILWVSIHSLHKISKYKGKDGIPPKVYKLGSGAWQKLKLSTKKKVKDIAKELIALYAKRKSEKGFSFSADTYMQTELESSFIYEDTPDQIKSTEDVKRDMESPMPMDRLICGDVGFGKTEIAIRAAFKAVTDGKQVAVLVPTTILALQHYNTFKERLKDFPCTVDYISRLKSTKHQNETLRNLEEGKIDILIGTHRIVSKDVKFKDMGLLVVDEEQKFGVAVKEKLKAIKLNVDTLTMTATPIPRTMQFSLMGARDLSIIQTPPPNRYPIITELHTFNEDTIREAIIYEVERGGQVFFINNRIQNITEVQDMLHRLCPGIKTVIAHGQMDGPRLEKVMLDFINQDFDVLIATSIIESGLDIPNANTIIINDAQNFGLSDLHQLRGRVGRTNKKAFCYLLAPPLTVLTPEAKRRLKAIENFSELGSGFNIALQDLDIRGAGNILGGEQSGFIADIGFETYQRILDEALLELREEEFKDQFGKPKRQEAIDAFPERSEKHKFVTDCVVDTDLELLFPDEYVYSISERMRLYSELDTINKEDVLEKFIGSLIDRFGQIPKQSLELINVVRLRWKAMNIGIEKIILKNQKMVAFFVSNPDSSFYKSDEFDKIIQFAMRNPKTCRLKEANQKFSMTYEGIYSVTETIGLLDKMLV